MLDNLYLPSGVELAGCAFRDCPSLKHIFSRDIAIPCLESSAFNGRVEEWHINAKGDKYVLLNQDGIGSAGVEKVYVTAGLKKINLYFGVKDFIRKTYIHGKETKLALRGGAKNIQMTLYTVADAASIKTTYLVYGRKTKQDKYRLVETTKKRKFSGAYRYVKVMAQRGWEICISQK